MRSTESGFNQEVYLLAAQERITTANLLLNRDAPDLVLATYLGGVAVECLFHAYRMRANADDSAKHDLARQAELGQFYDGMKRSQRQAVSALVGEVVARWQNNHRYRSVDAYRNYVIAKGLHVVQGKSTTKLDVAQYNAEQLLEAANELINVGVTRWNNSLPT